ncbi:MAG TPA: iron-containing alcohol dehydrogenase, partial [Propionibacteriaceae bacterium]|nr:iron-containing alcohol dehydrogenase [Propionibacteriaceae bacterium]
METLRVELGSRSYPILIGQGLLGERTLFDQYVRPRDILVVTNTVVAPLYLDALESSLQPRRVVATILPDREPQKTLANVARILDVLVANRFGRDCAVVALGGGVAGDMAGFAAATYQRGVAFVQVPTTLLAQVDSSVGGKTGVNHPGGKNLIGAFHQPIAVVADTRTLATLPPRELRAGLAEVIKYGLICDAGFFTWLEAHIDELLA